MTDAIFPPRNLPDRAEQWGRDVEGAISNIRGVVTQLQQTVDNGNRATSGQLAVLARQLTDLSERATLVSRLYSTLNISTNSSGLGVNHWSFYDFTITRPRTAVIDFAYAATLSQYVAGTSLGSYAVGFREGPSDPIQHLAISSIVGGPELYMASVGATSDFVRGAVSLRLLPGRYNVYLGGVVSGPPSLDSANLQIRNGISTMSIGQADDSIETSDIPPFTP